MANVLLAVDQRCVLADKHTAYARHAYFLCDKNFGVARTKAEREQTREEYHTDSGSASAGEVRTP
eukprot:7786-Heterococcus_DN1.PRE.2